MRSIKAIADAFVMQNNINAFPVDIEYIAEANGYHLLLYSDAPTAVLENEESLQHMALYKSFTVCIKREFFIMIKDGLSGHERRLAIAHEIGHIELHYTEITDSFHVGKDEVQEQEADEFALAVLAPVPLLYQSGYLSVDDIDKNTGIGIDAARDIAIKVARYARAKTHASTHRHLRHVITVVAIIFVLVCISLISLKSCYLTDENAASSAPNNSDDRSDASSHNDSSTWGKTFEEIYDEVMGIK